MRTTVTFFLLICVAMLFVGCMKGEQANSLKVTEDVELVDELPEDGQDPAEEQEEIKEETVTRQLFLIDANGMVVPQDIQLPKAEAKEVATQVLHYLVKGGPVTPLLPNGFQAVLPEDTEILSLNLQDDGTLIVDVSEHFKQYDAKDELSIIQAMTYTLTQFDTVDRIKLRIEGIDQDEMPVSGTPISQGYSRHNGINLIDHNFTDLLTSKAVTMYYPKQYKDTTYYVPVTQYLAREENQVISELVNTLIKGPQYDMNLIHVFNDGVTLQAEPVLENGVLQLVFNDDILKDEEKAIIADDVIETLVLSLTAQDLVDSIDIKVESKKQLVNENGKPYETPVSKQDINKQKSL